MSERARAKNQQNQSMIHSKCYMYGRSPQQNRCGRAIREVNRQPTRILVHQSRPDGLFHAYATAGPGAQAGAACFQADDSELEHQNLNFREMFNFKLTSSQWLLTCTFVTLSLSLLHGQVTSSQSSSGHGNFHTCLSPSSPGNSRAPIPSKAVAPTPWP